MTSRRLFTKTVLIISGLVACWVGASGLLTPEQFHAQAGIQVDGANLKNEMRAAGGLLFALGLFALGGGLVKSLEHTALGVSALTYGAYGGSRLLAFAVDGVHDSSLIWIAGIELLVAALCLAAWGLRSHQIANESRYW